MGRSRRIRLRGSSFPSVSPQRRRVITVRRVSVSFWCMISNRYKRFTPALLAAFMLPAAPLFAATAGAAQSASPGFSLEEVLGYPFPLHLVSNPATKTIAYVLDERGARNIFVADAPNFVPRMLTHYTSDDGQEL